MLSYDGYGGEHFFAEASELTLLSNTMYLKQISGENKIS